MSSWLDTPLGQARIEELNAAAEQRRKLAEQARAEAANRTRQRRTLKIQRRMYASAKASRLTDGWNPSNTSSDAELQSSLTALRSRSRANVRDSSYGKRCKIIVVNNIVGTGIGMQAQVKTTRGELNKRVNDEIEEQHEIWSEAKSCHTGGRLAFKLMQRQGAGQVFEAGEVLFRKYYEPMGRSRVPYALELIEAERLADEFQSPYLQAINSSNAVRMGVEVNSFHRPQAFHIRTMHPNEVRWPGATSGQVERVDAGLIYHLAMCDRWPQVRGEPWMHTALRRINDMDGYSEAEIVRSRVQASNVGAIETPDGNDAWGDQEGEGDDAEFVMEVEPGVFKRLKPGEKLNALAPSSPNPQLDPFMRYMIREVAAGGGVSYESLSRDFSQSNYSSSRLALLDDRDIWRFYQSWFICDFLYPVYREWLQMAILSRAIKSISMEEYAANPAKFEAVRFKPRGWSWVDPTREVQAYNLAVKSGFTTVSSVVASYGSGEDMEDVLEEREQELKLMKEKGLVFDTSPEVYTASSKQFAGLGAQAEAIADKTKEETDQIGKEPADADDPPPDEDSTDAPPRAGRFVLGVVK